MPGFGMHGQSLPVIKKAYDEFRRVAPLMIEGDYYPLTPYNRAPDQWVAWQFHLPEKDAGIVQAFRREKNQEDNRSTPLRGLDPAGRYRIVHFDGPDSPEEKTGEEMMKPGLILRLPQPRSAGIWEYQRIVETEEKKEAAPPAPAGP
jgi:alpha-galactosidase